MSAPDIPVPVAYPIAGSLQVRLHDDTHEFTATSDLASVAAYALGTCTAAAAGHVVVLHQPTTHRDLHRAINVRRNHPHLTVATVRDLVSATAALYRMWSANPNGYLTVVVGDYHDLVTDADGTHDAAIAVAWLKAVRSGDIETLAAITGLDAERYLRRPLRARPTTVVVQGRVGRRDAPGGVLHGVVGGADLVHAAASVIHVSGVTLDHANRTVSATVSVAKGPASWPVTTRIVRPLHGFGSWRSVA